MASLYGGNPFKVATPAKTTSPVRPPGSLSPSLDPNFKNNSISLDPNASAQQFKQPNYLGPTPNPNRPPAQPTTSGGGGGGSWGGTNVARAATTSQPLGGSSLSSGVDTRYQAKPGESASDYMARAATYYSNQNGGSSGSITGTGTASTPQTPTQAPPPPQEVAPDRFAQLNALQGAAAQYYQPTQQEQDAMQQLGNVLASRDLGLAKISNNPQPLDLITGQSAYLQNQAAAMTRPLEAQLGILQARRQAAIEGYKTAIGAEQAKLGFQQPVSVGLGQALISPTTGQQIGGNADYNSLSGGGGGLIGSLAQQVISGQLTPSQAVAQLPSQALAGALNQAITRVQPNFNFNAAEQNAQARASALNQNITQVRPLVNAQQTAIDHLKNMEEIIKKVGYTNVPFLNQLREGFSNTVSSDPNIRQLQSEVNIIRGEVAKVLGGGSVTVESLKEAQQIVPDKISPEQFQSVAQNIRKLMEDKIAQYTNLDNIQQFPTGGTQLQGGGMFGSFF